MINYLHSSRYIPNQLIQHVIQNKNLYADSHANAVFIMRDSAHQPVGAELRGTGTTPWRGMAPGSRKNHGYFAIGPTQHNAITLCESAIDALSCFTLNPTHLCISTAGTTRPDPTWLQPLLNTNIPIYCGFDNDPPGDTMASNMILQHPSIKRLRPIQKDWNETLSTFC